jgi:S1-C subfamily serine protease
MRPIAAGLLGLTLIVGAACSSADKTPSPSDSSGQSSSQATQAPKATPQTTVNKSANELSTADLVKRAEPSIVRIETNSGVGTGFVVDSDGYILTNNHVTQTANGRTASNIRVTLSDGSVLSATIVGADSKSDLAVLKIDKTGLTALPFADLADVQIGQDVVAIGYALDLGRGEGPSYSVTRGIVSQKNRGIDEGSGTTGTTILGAIQTDAAINHGNSGGPLLNLFGEVVGINTALAPDPTTGGTADGIGFAVGSDVAKAVFEQIKANGKVNRGFLGIGGFEALRPAKAKDLNIPDGTQGLLVGSVDAGSPAGQAGLKANDVITKLGNTTITNEADLAVSLIRQNAGQKVTVEYYRDGKKGSVDVTLGTPQS